MPKVLRSRIKQALLLALTRQTVTRPPRVVADVGRVVWMSLRTVRLRAVFTRARRFHPTPLGEHVLRVVASGTQEQVSGVDAASVVTAMEDEEPIGDRTVSQLPRYTVGPKVWPTFVACGAHFAIPLVVAMSGPLPTVIGAARVDLFPKTLSDRSSFHSLSNLVSTGVMGNANMVVK